MLDLYENFYKLTADPFRLSPDHRFVLDHRSYAKSKSYLEYALHRGEGFIVITGGAGTGKTTLISEILEKLDKTHIQVATLNSTQLESRDMLHMVAASFDLPLKDKEMDKADLLLLLEEFLKQQGKKGRRAVLIVDEAQGLSPSALEELRLLANLQFKSRLLLQVFLVGQEPLRELIGAPEMDHLRQRIVAASHIEPLTLSETVDYVEYRLSRVGWQDDPTIDAEALMLIHRYSGGVPRRINLICSRLFLYGAMEEKHELAGADTQSVIEDLQQEHLMAPVAEQLVNGTTGMPSRVGVLAEEREKASVYSLPREKKTVESADLKKDMSSAQPINDPVERLEKCDVEDEKDFPESPPYSDKDVWDEIEELKQELKDSSAEFESSESPEDDSNQAGEDLVEDEPQGKKTEPGISEEWADKDNPSAEAMPVDSIIPHQSPYYTPQAMAEKAGDSGKRKVAAIALITLVIGIVLAIVLGTDDSADDNMSDIVSKKIIAEPQGTVQRETPGTETPVGSVQSVDTESERPVAKAAPEQISTDLSSMEDPLPDSSATEGSGTPHIVQSGEEKLPLEPSVETQFPEPSKTGSTSTHVPPVAVTQVAETAIDKGEKEEKPLSIEEQKAQLRVEAVNRLNQRLTERPPGAEETSNVVPVPPSEAQAPVAKEPQAPARVPVVEPVKKIQPSRPKVSVQKASPVPVVTASAPSSKVEPTSKVDRIKSALMAGGWTSRGKPATLLPSEITLCQQVGAHVACRSVPQNINTSYGLAIYEVEATIKSFSATGEFRLSYRTLVRLLEDDSSSDSDGWQITDHSMTCQLTQLSKILCQDDAKGTKREYLRL